MILAEVSKIHRYIRLHTCFFYCNKPLNVVVLVIIATTAFLLRLSYDRVVCHKLSERERPLQMDLS